MEPWNRKKESRCGAGDMIFIPAEEKHRLRAQEPLFISSSSANRFVTTILDGTQDDLRWNAWKAEFGFKRKTR